MPIHRLKRSQIIPAPLDDCWRFFSNPGNLPKITPPELAFTLLGETPEKIHAGLMIHYRLKPLLGIPVRWLSEITQVDAPRYFVDEQRAGPYALWHHEHSFRRLDAEHTEITDLVHYALPLWLAGEIVHQFVVKKQIAKIFDFRERATARLFDA